jgi:hypothetical protein
MDRTENCTELYRRLNPEGIVKMYYKRDLGRSLSTDMPCGTRRHAELPLLRSALPAQPVDATLFKLVVSMGRRNTQLEPTLH